MNTSLHNRIPAFFIDRGAKYTVLFSHGNAEDLGMIYDWFKEMSQEIDVNIMAYDYAGYGISLGETSEEAIYADIEAAFAYLTTVKDIPPSSIILYGRSLGTGPTCYLAAKQSKLRQPVRGIVLQSPLLSAYRVAFHFRFSMPGDMFCNIDVIDKVECPVMIIHGTRDEVVPFWHGQELFLNIQTKYRARPFWVEGAGHNNIEVLLRVNRTFFEYLERFIKSCHLPDHQ